MLSTRLAIAVSFLLSAQLLPALSSKAQSGDDKSAGAPASVPRESADKYRVHAEQSGVSIGAELLTRKEVAKNLAATDVNRCCLVVQVAVYPKSDEPLQVSLNDFTLTREDGGSPARPQGAAVISAKLEKKDGSSTNVMTETSVSVGVASGTYKDPNTGQTVRSHGTYTTASAGVGIVTDSTAPAAAEQRRKTIETELSEKGLPEARISVPVAGYLYFFIPKAKKDAKYRLEFSSKGETLILQLP